MLGSLGIYFLLIFKVPEFVLNSLERSRASFFLGSQESKKLAWNKCPNVLSSFEKDGLNIGSLKSFNLALLQKWCWRMSSNPKALWGKLSRLCTVKRGVSINKVAKLMVLGLR